MSNLSLKSCSVRRSFALRGGAVTQFLQSHHKAYNNANRMSCDDTLRTAACYLHIILMPIGTPQYPLHARDKRHAASLSQGARTPLAL
eukprot:4966779-Amphidinium_carterae.1